MHFHLAIRPVVRLPASVTGSSLRFAFKAYRRPFRVPVRTSRGVWEAREGIVLRLDREDGASGLGEIAPLESFGTETFAGALAWCATVSSRPELQRLREIPRHLPCCAAAVGAALRMLAVDSAPTAPAVQPKAAPRTLPVAQLLPTGAAAVDALARGADAGFTTFKLKIGAADFAVERVLVERLAAQLPKAARLRLDANGGLDARLAARWLAAAEAWPVEFIEQPLAAPATHDLLALAHDHPVPVALDESVRGADDIKRWRDLGWPGMFVIKPALAGPADELLREIAVAPDAFVFSSALETAVGTRAGLQLALASGTSRALGYGVGAFFNDDDLGGALSRPVFAASDLDAMQPEDVWNRL